MVENSRYREVTQVGKRKVLVEYTPGDVEIYLGACVVSEGHGHKVAQNHAGHAHVRPAQQAQGQKEHVGHAVLEAEGHKGGNGHPQAGQLGARVL